MEQSIHRYFRLGLVQFMAYPEGDAVANHKKTLADDYFDAIEITRVEDAAARERVRQMIAQSHAAALYGAQPLLLGSGLNPSDLNEAGRLAAEALLLDALDDAAEMGCEGLSFLSGPWDPRKREEGLAQLLRTTSALCARAAAKGMQIELEAFDYDLDKKALIGPAPLAARFAGEVRCAHQNFGLLVDLSHLPQTREDARYALRVVRPYLTHLHIGNAVVTPGAAAYGDQHPRFGIPNGVNDVPELLEFLAACRDEGLMDAHCLLTLSFEVKPQMGEDADLVVANAKRTLNRAWALLELPRG